MYEGVGVRDFMSREGVDRKAGQDLDKQVLALPHHEPSRAIWVTIGAKPRIVRVEVVNKKLEHNRAVQSCGY